MLYVALLYHLPALFRQEQQVKHILAPC
jgi:hypothetical protein